jgi:glycosyltransferase involved in cell wall biosynthesis
MWNKLPQLIFVGRLSHEKGFDRVMRVVDAILASDILATLHICWDGIYMDALRARSGLSDAGIFVHGFISATEMNTLLQTSQYMLMPSRFLETFGLSALESITAGVPVIGFCKGGLSQFLFGEGAITSLDSLDTTSAERADLIDSALYHERVTSICAEYNPVAWRQESDHARQMSRAYSRDIWYATLAQGIQPNERILVMTDYSGNIGGIESYTKSISEELRSRGHLVKNIYSAQWTSRMLRYLWLIGTAFNISFALRLSRAISTEKLDVIWLQSVMRAIWPIGLFPLFWYKGKILITYHDLGYFLPYPTNIFNESQIGIFGWRRFAQDITGPFSAIAIFAKYCNLLLLHCILRHVHYHCIPSEFLGASVQSFFPRGATPKIIVLPHFNPHIWA